MQHPDKPDGSESQLLSIAKTGHAAAELAADLDGVKDSTDTCVITRIVDDNGVRLGSLSTLDGNGHLELLIEATQRFAQGLGVDLHMVYGSGQPGGQG